MGRQAPCVQAEEEEEDKEEAGVGLFHFRQHMIHSMIHSILHTERHTERGQHFAEWYRVVWRRQDQQRQNSDRASSPAAPSRSHLAVFCQPGNIRTTVRRCMLFVPIAPPHLPPIPHPLPPPRYRFPWANRRRKIYEPQHTEEAPSTWFIRVCGIVNLICMGAYLWWRFMRSLINVDHIIWAYTFLGAECIMALGMIVGHSSRSFPVHREKVTG